MKISHWIGAVTAAALFVPVVAEAQEADALFRDFEPSGEFQVTLDDQPLEGAEVFLAKRAGAYLVTAPGLETVLLVNVRTKNVESLTEESIRRNGDSGTLDVMADAVFDPLGSFELKGEQVTIVLDAGRLALGPKPPLLGLQESQGLVDHNPSYGHKASGHTPAPEALAALAAEKRNVVVRTYFGTWCPTCSRLVPLLIRVDRDLAKTESAIDFEYYGLPRSMDDPTAEAMGIRGVPTAVVTVDAKEVGRLGAQELTDPEKALADLLGSAR